MFEDIEKICYYEFLRENGLRARVRFGASRRPEAQIVTARERWAVIADFLRDDGYRLVRVDPRVPSYATPPPRT
jgi:hypothetical protein